MLVHRHRLRLPLTLEEGAMKKGTLVLLSIAAVAGMTNLANATPTGVNDFISGGGSGISEAAQNGGGPNLAQNAQNVGTTVSQGAPYVGGRTSAVTAQVQSVPEPGSLLMLGAGFLALVLWHQFRQRIHN
jgi:hypothetical protein